MATRTSATSPRHLRDLFDVGTVVGLSDDELLARYAVSHDGPAFEALVARHGPMVVATCRAILRHDHDVEDAFQATFLVLARKARTVRGGGALGGWLHRVAYRIAVEASAASNRRRRREAEESVMNVPDQTRPALDFDLRALLHREIDRLPDFERVVVVLCELEGLTYEQAARRLQSTVSTVCHRLARARKRLRDRLSRRGATAVALGALAASSPATAAVPAAWAHAAVTAATGGAASSTVVALSQTIIRGMFMAKLRFSAMCGLAALAVSAGAVVISAAQTDRVERKDKPPQSVKGVPQTHQAAPSEIRGRVISPDGKPVFGATVTMARFDDQDDRANPQTTSGQDGRFLLRFGRPTRNSAMLNGQDMFPWVVASAVGFGPVKIENAVKVAASGDLTIRLVEDGPPIEGRIVDLEGRPVAGARLVAARLYFAGNGELTSWLSQAKDRGVRSPGDGLDVVPTIITSTTSADGRFRMTGTGRERVIEMLVSGPTIATTQFYAMNRDGVDFRVNDRQSTKTSPWTIHARRFGHAVAPTKPIEGTIRDKDRGRPIAGLTVRGAVYDSQNLVSAPGIEAMTDAQGRYRLSGLPKASAYRLFVESTEGKPYHRATFRAPANSPAFEPASFDIALKRGVLIRGQITDKATGQPVPGYVNVFTFQSNPASKNYPGYVLNDLAYAFIKEDGRYEIVGLPGRNIIACRSEVRRYRGYIGAENLQGYDPKQLAFFDTLPLSCYFRNYHVLAELDIDPAAETANLDLQVDPGRTVTLTAVDAEGKLVGGTKASGISDLFSSSIDYEQASPKFDVHGLDSSRPRRVIVTHAGRKLIGSVYLTGDGASSMTIQLLPWGTISGRVVDEDGKPRGGLAINSAGGSYPDRTDERGILPAGDSGGPMRIGSDGRFRVERLVPGLKYGATAAERGIGVGDLFHDVIVASGEVKELGDLKVIPFKDRRP